MNDDDFIGLPPGMLDSGTFRAPLRTERPRADKPDIVFVPTVPGMPVPPARRSTAPAGPSPPNPAVVYAALLETARDRTTDPDVLADLARDEHTLVRMLVAGNPATPPAVLLALAQDPRTRIGDRVADNPSAPADALRLLAASPELSRPRRHSLARNPASPHDVLAALVHDPDAAYLIARRDDIDDDLRVTIALAHHGRP